MDEFLKNLDAMSIEELEHVISSAQMLIQKKQQEAIRLAELEKQRQEQERLEAERKKQEEIAALQRRLKELQGNTQSDNQPKVQEDTTHEKAQQSIQQDTSAAFAAAESEETKTALAKGQGYSMISCPECHKLLPSDSRFCFYCGGDIAQKKESKPVDFAESFSSQFGSSSSVKTFTLCTNCRTPVPSGSQFCQNCGKPIGSASQDTKPQQNVPKKTTVYMGDDMKKWDTLAGESDVLAWKETSLLLPEKLPFAHIKVTTQRILISSESRMSRGARNSSLLAYAATSANEHGKPWAMIPLECVRSFRQSGKTEITIDADKTFKFVVMGSSLTFGKAKTYTSDIYEALRKVMPDKAL
ncbi:zinc ribbon domain-containing protein [Wansuia hejianensis]|uniref:Zinc ribbon domain-containing protein n=1 Tax=Wansuia hejianensis TaxID=2763667 RepID=A0A7G9GG10_9FIRM|nr:zinc ribbon domain-containing protein [Wansuia hejianensis]QNM09742.1 zinc ribbon domain-containing protein [Wansuia hejianensis]RHV91080.1 hypothetical protein DXA96_04395 [Lachnospiraceae bacterium OF09-33XD]